MSLFLLVALFVATPETYAMELHDPATEGGSGTLLSDWFAPLENADLGEGVSEAGSLQDKGDSQFQLTAAKISVFLFL